jgi:NTE family protein
MSSPRIGIRKPSRRIEWTGVAAIGLFSSGCLGPVVKNGPLAERNIQTGYRFDVLDPGPDNTNDTFICLCFSGGGTRAAALSFGVLQALRDTPIPPSADGRHARRLLDEVDVISSVSGGSFTSMSYGLDRDAVFDGRFEREFLKQNIQNQLIFMLLRPKNLLLLPYVMLDRVDLAADYYDKAVFDHRTFRDLLDRGDRPYLVINATNMALGERFEFTQDDFDLIGSDLATLPVGHAVAASSAFPLLFSPLRLKYYPGAAADSAIDAALTDPNSRAQQGRRYKWASNLTPQVETAGEQPTHTLDADNHQYLYLLDGGLTDNLGVTYVIDELRSGRIRGMIDVGGIKKLVIIIVDANTDAPAPIEHQAGAPGLFLMAEKTGTTSMYNYSKAMTNVLRFMLRELPERLREMDDRCRASMNRQCPDAAPPDTLAALNVQTYLVEVSLHDIADPKSRRRFLAMPTSFFLSQGDVDALIDMGRTLLTQSDDFQRLLRDFGGP